MREHVILISEAALTLLDADELQAWWRTKSGTSTSGRNANVPSDSLTASRLKDLELMCDGIAIVTLHGLGMDVSRLMSGVRENQPFQPGTVRDGEQREGLPNPCPTPGVCAGDGGAIR